MKKTIVTLTLASAAFISTSVFAQTANNNNCPAAPCPPCGPGCNGCAPCPYFQKPDSCVMNPFAELNLTADQQAKIKELRNKKFQQTTKDIKNRRELSQAKRQAYLHERKSILTQEQYVQFLENSYANGPAFGKGDMPKRGPRHHHGRRPGNCPQSGACPVAPCQNAAPTSK